VPDFAEPQSLNRYAYTLNNPVRFNDPSGHCPPAKDCLKALAEGAALTVNKANEYRDDIFFPDENTTFEDRWEASVVVGTGSALIAFEALIFAPTATAYAAVGEATGATGNILSQVFSNLIADEDDIMAIDWLDVTIAGMVGFGTGAVTPSFGTTYKGVMTLGGLSGGSQYTLSQVAHGEDVDILELLLSGTLGVLSAGIAGPAPGPEATHFVDQRDLVYRQLEGIERFGGARAFTGATASNMDLVQVTFWIEELLSETE